MVKCGGAGRKTYAFQLRVRPSLLVLAMLAGIITCFMVVTHRRCELDDSYAIRYT